MDSQAGANGANVTDLSGTINNPNLIDPILPDNTLPGTPASNTGTADAAAIRSMAIANRDRHFNIRLDQMSQQMAAMERLITTLSSTLTVIAQPAQNTVVNTHRPLENNFQNSANTNSFGTMSSGSDVTRNDSRIKIDKWGLHFDGDNSHLPVEDFIFRLEHLKTRHEMPWEEILRDFQLLMTGQAKEWYWLFIKTHTNYNWETLRAALLQRYQSARSDLEIMRDLVERRQQPGETIDAFFHAMGDMRSRLSIAISEDQMVKMLKKNLKESVARHVYQMAVRNVEELRRECLDAEKTFGRRDKPPFPVTSNRYMRPVNELYEPELQAENSWEEVEALQVPQMQTKRTLVCWNCGQEDDHTWWYCPEPQSKIFCYKCGKPDVKLVDCPKCTQGNQGRRLAPRANQRSEPSPADHHPQSK